MTRLFLITWAACLIWLVAAHAQPQNAMPDFGIERGTLEGELFTQGKAQKRPVVDAVVALMVFESGKRILMLNKRTDAKGRFMFANIFKDKNFSYALASIYNEKLYMMADLQLKKPADSIQASFQVGPGSPNESIDIKDHPEMAAGSDPQAPPPAMLKASEGKTPFSVTSMWGQMHQKMALGLSILVVMLGIYFY